MTVTVLFCCKKPQYKSTIETLNTTIVFVCNIVLNMCTFNFVVQYRITISRFKHKESYLFCVD